MTHATLTTPITFEAWRHRANMMMHHWPRLCPSPSPETRRCMLTIWTWVSRQPRLQVSGAAKWTAASSHRPKQQPSTCTQWPLHSIESRTNACESRTVKHLSHSPHISFCSSRHSTASISSRNQGSYTIVWSGTWETSIQSERSFIWWPFTSTTTNGHTLERPLVSGEAGTMFNVNAASLVDIKPCQAVQSEDERLLLPGIRFKGTVCSCLSGFLLIDHWFFSREIHVMMSVDYYHCILHCVGTLDIWPDDHHD